MEEQNARIVKEWTVGWWLWKKTIRVEAEQVDPPSECFEFVCAAEVKIYLNGELVYEVEAPWTMPKGEITLPLQVYTLGVQLDFPHPEWQPVFKRFAFMCEKFELPDRIWWVDSSFVA